MDELSDLCAQTRTGCETRLPFSNAYDETIEESQAARFKL